MNALIKRIQNHYSQIKFLAVLPATAIQISSGDGSQGIHTLTMTNATAGGAIVQYSPGQEFFVPGNFFNFRRSSNFNKTRLFQWWRRQAA